jgi:hydrogenase nickel incorporation protein HypA/HybF
MHELSLLQGVVTAVESALSAQAQGARKVKSVELRVGSMSGAVPEALEGAWPLAIAGTALEGASLDIDYRQAAIWCENCQQEREIDEFFALVCPVCGTPTGNLIRGREFEVASAEIDD